MKTYVTRRLLILIPILIGVSIIVFLLIASIPGDAIDAKFGASRLPAEKIAEMKALLGLNQPVGVRYLNWLKNALHGNLGISTQYNLPVATVIHDFIWNSFLLAIVSFVLELLIAIPVGVLSATKIHSFFDNLFTVLAFAGISLPSFFLALLLQKGFAVDWKMLPMDGMHTVGVTLAGGAYLMDILSHMILPVICLTTISVGGAMRFVRTSMLDVINQDYIRTARSKGLPERIVIYRHALKNAAIPIITYIGNSLPGLFSGALITETVFAWPGIGKIFLESIAKRDYLFMMGYVMLVALLTMLGNLLADILYSVADPRIRLK
ncbi:Dipeptide transport system permease protein DppB [Caprobacter fermentans]|uniref:Dipeptide transport system permease protein DppB n=1 Tax=Caproicibacter fermentans TaxID=2576756 RepID=A0A6N8I572_9FIRM|nr:ABC transporter permease [Caproicibacter fermentans]MVB13118.1 Dipeptide transport system permease protein DppB [Caproicibacter fermentans]OCN01032.1 diguanylate cyclase [Clostridium sp. W14A]